MQETGHVSKDQVLQRFHHPFDQYFTTSMWPRIAIQRA